MTACVPTSDAGAQERWSTDFSRYAVDANPGSAPTYRSVAEELGLKESDVRNYLRHCRVRLREILSAELRDTVARPGEVEGELRAVLAG